jgi:hypothetical protein
MDDAEIISCWRAIAPNPHNGTAGNGARYRSEDELRHPWRLSRAPDEPAGIDKIAQHFCTHAMQQYAPEGPSQPRHFCQCGLNRTG